MSGVVQFAQRLPQRIAVKQGSVVGVVIFVHVGSFYLGVCPNNIFVELRLQAPCGIFFNRYIVAMLKSERIGYGYNRSDRDFRGHDCDFVILDTKATKRESRVDLMQRLKSGDTLVIFSWKELAPGALKASMQADLDRIGVTVELLDIPPKPKVNPSARGLSDEAKAEALTMWRKPTLFSVDYIQSHLTRKGLGTYSRNQLNYALGPRTKPIDDPLEVEE